MTTSGFVALAAAGLAIVLLPFGKQGRMLTACSLIAGLAIVPWAAPRVVGAVRSLDSLAFDGTAVLIAVVATGWVVFELKDSGTQAPTPWIALAAPCLWLAAGGPFVGLYELLQSGLEGAEQFTNDFNIEDY